MHISELYHIIRGVTYKKENVSTIPTKRIILTADNITDKGKFVIKKEIYLRENIYIDETKKLYKDDCFICFSSGSKNHVGKSAYISTDTDYYAGGFMGILRPKNTDFLPKYVAYALSTPSFRKTISELSSGSNINNLSNKIGELSIILPLQEKQVEVVSEIETLEAKIAEAQAIMDSCSSRKAAILNKYLM